MNVNTSNNLRCCRLTPAVAGIALIASLATTGFVHFCINTSAQFPIEGHTVYLNDIMNLQEFDEEFGATPHMQNPRVASFIKLVADRAGELLSEDRRNADVWMIPFGRKGGTCGGWPFVSRDAETIVFVETAKQLAQFRITESGQPSLRVWGLLLNWGVFAILFFGLLSVAAFAWQRYRSCRSQRDSAFPVVTD